MSSPADILDAALVGAREAVTGGDGHYASALLHPVYLGDQHAVERILADLRDQLPAGDVVLRAEKVRTSLGTYLVLAMGLPR